ncbi:hypothetical protein HN358_03435 [Candidatus Uhrbacteria bacterium]|jgi:hypothetical protein|nr:hypothetical protein [Candidatus Uhrbacteria bacterium]MBT7716980.1 hypothetical protein [Candidatus Uhrbacteria bacterium]
MKKGFTGIWILFLAAAIALAIVAFGFGYWLSNESDSDVEYVDDMVEVDISDEVDDEEVEIEIEVTEPTILENSDAINVSWYSEISEIEPLAIFTEHLNLIEATDDDPNRAFSLGEVVGGDYDGAELTMQIVYYWGMGTYYEQYYVLVPADEAQKPVLIDEYLMGETSFLSFTSYFRSFLELMTDRNEYWDDEQRMHYYEFVSGIEFDMESYIPELEYGEVGTDSYGNTYEFLGPGALSFFPEEKDIALFEVYSYIDGGSLYAVDGDEGTFGNMANLFFAVEDDGRVLAYDAQIPFWDYETSGYSMDLEVVGDETFSGTYSKAHGGGCGYTNATNTVDESEIGELEYIGSVSGGHELYESANYSLELYGDDYDTWSYWHEGSRFEDFLALHPFLYYQDQLGRWIQLSNVEVLPQAECGKPVIYLYPESEMEIDVFIEPEGGFTYTEPVYDGGWSVLAQPDGTLTNLKDGKTYPYLFWEGRGGLYSPPENYWVVEQDQVERFLIKTLGKYGLNRQETFDFMEFWYPRMQDAPYYQIGFHGTEVMDAIAPMELSVQPDTIFRILMDFIELEEPAVSNPTSIRGFDRNGFTVVEWGGVIQ